MAKFCTKCGSPLKEGQVCECESKEEVKTTKEKSGQAKNIWDQIVDIFKGSFKKPYATMKKTKSEKYLWASLITIAASAVGLTMVLIKTIKVIYEQSVNAVGSSFGVSNLSSATSLDINIFKTFFMVLLLLAVFYFVYTMTAYIFTNKIQKKNNSYKEILASMAVPAMVSTVFSIGSWILLALLGFFGLLGVSAGMILATFYRYQALMVSTNVDNDKAGYVILAAQMITAITIAIVFSIIGASAYVNATPTINGLSMIQFIR